MIGALLAASRPRLSIFIGVQVVVVHVLWVINAGLSSHSGAVSPVGNFVPASLRFVSEQDVSAVLPSEPPCHLVAEREDLVLGMLVQPVVHRAMVLRGVDVEVTWEFALESGEDVVER